MKGFTLIEVLVVVVIFMAVAMIVLSTVFLSSQIYSHQEKTTEVLQNGRVVVDAVSREIRQTRKIITQLSEEKVDGSDEIIFQDGHLTEIIKEGIIQGGSGDKIVLDEGSSTIDNYYNDVYIKVYDAYDYEIRKIINYDGYTKEAVLEKPLEIFSHYSGLNYLIDTRHYYIRYFLDDQGYVKREVFTYYFSGNENLYVPHNAQPPEGETINLETLEVPRIFGEHVEELIFWGEKPVNIFLNLKVDDKRLELHNSVFSRNI